MKATHGMCMKCVCVKCEEFLDCNTCPPDCPGPVTEDDGCHGFELAERLTGGGGE